MPTLTWSFSLAADARLERSRLETSTIYHLNPPQRNKPQLSMLAFAPQGEMKENKIGPPTPDRHVSLTYAYTPCTRSHLAQKTAFYSRLPTLQSCDINPSWRLIHDIKFFSCYIFDPSNNGAT
ncbi:uncharacterized protein BO87DRAFT_163074 [Aspergillus neoniger CBS 115656]|uniref:Uncharacterized protein n=1 Tax=Aspergillus neoniger (strain CBS 115656) TaxID=1448310 RepID=A0A318Z304_ASPNB|nr:hypothetical protein BO87DRAFT_163074 [Aspergillus neoniger CBS 115656]PYH38180.1 hypothetical protein BO87DRAFT_163074 [Aspergillus neoniger CBS 115656]